VEDREISTIHSWQPTLSNL